LTVLLGVSATAGLVWADGGRVAFDSAGNTLVNGKPFFPIGLFIYSLDTTVMAEAHKLHFNTLALFTEQHQPAQ
jgi:hypothetical protein